MCVNVNASFGCFEMGSEYITVVGGEKGRAACQRRGRKKMESQGEEFVVFGFSVQRRTAIRE